MAKRKTKKKKHFTLRFFLLLIALIVLFIALCFITPTEAEVITASVGNIPNLELPAPVEGEQLIKHTGYTLSYNEEAEQPSYVAYELTREEVYGALDRVDDFRADPLVTTGSATLDDYKNSGYDRGHMAPAADFKWSKEAMSDTFYLSNMSPQVGALNRGRWADLEAVVRQMAVDNEKIYIATGPVLTDGPFKTIGKNKVAVPNQYYKVILDYTDPDIKAIGFVMPNKDINDSIENYIVTVDEVEALTGLDFFPALPDDAEALLEAEVNPSKWSFRQYSGTSDANKTLIETPTDTRGQLLSAFNSVFYEIKKEVFKALGLTKIAKEYNLI